MLQIFAQTSELCNSSHFISPYQTLYNIKILFRADDILQILLLCHDSAFECTQMKGLKIRYVKDLKNDLS